MPKNSIMIKLTKLDGEVVMNSKYGGPRLMDHKLKEYNVFYITSEKNESYVAEGYVDVDESDLWDILLANMAMEGNIEAINEKLGIKICRQTPVSELKAEYGLKIWGHDLDTDLYADNVPESTSILFSMMDKEMRMCYRVASNKLIGGKEDENYHVIKDNLEMWVE